ncbi:MAG: glycosyl hydrolase [Gammaproteobacteria bacterium]
MQGLIDLLVVWVVSGTALFVWSYRHCIRRAWCEPVLRQLVVVFESDDWGPGSSSDVRALQRLTDILESCRDSTGHPAVMTIGVVLAVPDTRRTEVRRGEEYISRQLDDEEFSAIRTALADGERRGVFALQLHGMEHYWPAALMEAARKDRKVLRWLNDEAVPRTEGLPSALQTRWANCVTLPSSAIDENAIQKAVHDEVAVFSRVFGHTPQVVVPPTFVWTDAAERAWAANDVEVIVTPGRQYTGRDSAGAPKGGCERFWNGQTGASGMARIVRDTYFEPAFGHRKDDAIRVLQHRLRSGQPALFETHRFNFLPELSDDVEAAFAEFQGLLNDARDRFPQLVFRSTRELAAVLGRRERQFVERSRWRRIWPVVFRLNAVPGLRRWALLSGAVVPGMCLIVIGWLARRRLCAKRVSGSARA